MFKITGTVRLTVDPEIRVTPKGTQIAEARCAVNNRFRDASGNNKEEADFWNLKVWGDLAENFGKLLSKGRRIVIHGDLRQDHWEDKETKKPRSSPYINVTAWEFADGKPAEKDEAEDYAEKAEAGSDKKVPF